MEIFAALAAAFMFFVPGFFTHDSKGKSEEPPKKTIAALLKPSQTPSTPPSAQPEQGKKVPTPALLPGLVVLFGNALRKKGQKDRSTAADS